ncbi:hypothetical protein M2G58_13715 [Vibrio vulnificus]|nr:hypothetical protein [Vibrio vulnificus]
MAKLVKNELANLWQNTSSKRQDLTLMSPVKLFWDNREFLPHKFVVTEASKNYQKKYCVLMSSFLLKGKADAIVILEITTIIKNSGILLIFSLDRRQLFLT